MLFNWVVGFGDKSQHDNDKAKKGKQVNPKYDFFLFWKIGVKVLFFDRAFLGFVLFHMKSTKLFAHLVLHWTAHLKL